MKKNVIAGIALILFGILLAVLSLNVLRTREKDLYACPPSICWNDEVYYFFQADKLLSDRISEESAVGRITKVISPFDMPDENGEANFPSAENAALSEYEGGLWMHHPDGYWYLLTLKSEADAE